MSTPRAALVDEAVQLQRQCNRALRAAAGPSWLELDLTMGQVKGLWTLAGRGPLTVGEVGAALGVGKPAASTLVDRLVQLGLARREDDPADRRRTFVSLSRAGEDVIERLRQGRRARLREWFSRLDDDDLTALVRGLRALVAATASDERASEAAG